MDILNVLEPIWSTKTETASRLRQRIRTVLDWAAARDYRQNHDPHIWDQIAISLPLVKDIKRAKHFASCPYSDIASTINTIKQSSSTKIVKLGLEFIVLTAARSGEVRKAIWKEIDFNKKSWIIPAEKMKANREHRVPLSSSALEILAQIKALKNGSEYIFPNDKGSPISDMTFTMALRRLGFEFTVHGFRSTFRDWAAEQTSFPREVCEAALAHSNRDATEAAYFRSDLFEKRREMMEKWATYVKQSSSMSLVP